MTGQRYSGSLEAQPSAREQANRRLARRAAAEGMVLMKNDGLLPLDPGIPVALFGCGAVKTVKGGTGSGDVNNRETVSICQGMRDAGAVIISEAWLKDYEKCYDNARMAWKEKVLEAVKSLENPFDAYAANPFSLPEGRKITADDVEGAEAVIYVISRISGEGMDRRREEGDYYVSRREREDLLWLDKTGLPIVLVLNTGAPVELTDLLDEARNIRAVLNISLPGQEGGHAAADVLFGWESPGGRLTATWARRYEDYPCGESFGRLNGNLDIEEYREGIYVGYRYFDSFGIKPLFPFGYGLSYTSFSISPAGIRRTEQGIEITVIVKNTGAVYSGREVVQVYAVLPQTEYKKEFKRLIGFAKTVSLKPGKEQRLAICTDQSAFASFSEELQAWYMDAGTYSIWVGAHGEALQPAALIRVQQKSILEETKKICPLDAPFDGLYPDENVRRKAGEWFKTAEEQQVPVLLYTPRKKEEGNSAQASLADGPSAAAGLSVAELIPALYGNITQGTSTLGSAGTRVPGSAGETTEALEDSYGIRSLIMADGPAGLRLRQSYEADRETGSVYGVGVLGSLENGFLEKAGHHENTDTCYQYCTAFPVGTAMAQSWDLELMQKFGEAVAAEMEEFGVDLWLAPGMNIQRNPLCGRNFEYYSEDPLLSGMMAASVTKGVQSHHGRGVTLKHFACNNQEDNRMGVNVRVAQRALREIYLRGFEIAVKKSRPVAMMSAYNRINGVHAANSLDLCTTAARGEWGFEGIIMSDWNTTVPEDGSVPWQCIAAGNDIIMPGNQKDDEEIRRAYEQGELTEEMIRRSAGRLFAAVRRLTDKI
ncbi:glycoside hydrolase family 3 C-terminal domain-containing protein [Lachnospiraceae bacterium 48-42]|nr:beta-glucosidase [Dorea sp.]